MKILLMFVACCLEDASNQRYYDLYFQSLKENVIQQPGVDQVKILCFLDWDTDLYTSIKHLDQIRSKYDVDMDVMWDSDSPKFQSSSAHIHGINHLFEYVNYRWDTTFCHYDFQILTDFDIKFKENFTERLNNYDQAAKALGEDGLIVGNIEKTPALRARFTDGEWRNGCDNYDKIESGIESEEVDHLQLRFPRVRPFFLLFSGSHFVNHSDGFVNTFWKYQKLVRWHILSRVNQTHVHDDSQWETWFNETVGIDVDTGTNYFSKLFEEHANKGPLQFLHLKKEQLPVFHMHHLVTALMHHEDKDYRQSKIEEYEDLLNTLDGGTKSERNS